MRLRPHLGGVDACARQVRPVRQQVDQGAATVEDGRADHHCLERRVVDVPRLGRRIDEHRRTAVEVEQRVVGEIRQHRGVVDELCLPPEDAVGKVAEVSFDPLVNHPVVPALADPGAQKDGVRVPSGPLTFVLERVGRQRNGDRRRAVAELRRLDLGQVRVALSEDEASSHRSDLLEQRRRPGLEEFRVAPWILATEHAGDDDPTELSAGLAEGREIGGDRCDEDVEVPVEDAGHGGAPGAAIEVVGVQHPQRPGRQAQRLVVFERDHAAAILGVVARDYLGEEHLVTEVLEDRYLCLHQGPVVDDPQQPADTGHVNRLPRSRRSCSTVSTGAPSRRARPLRHRARRSSHSGPRGAGR